MKLLFEPEGKVMNKKLLLLVFLLSVVKNYAMEQEAKEQKKDDPNVEEVRSLNELHSILTEKNPNIGQVIRGLDALRIKKIADLSRENQIKIFLGYFSVFRHDDAYDFLCCSKKLMGDATDEQGTPILLRSIEENCSKKVAEMLLIRGAKANGHLNNPNRAPLLSATIVGNVDVAELLLAKGADSTFTNDEGQTALRLAVAQVQKYSEGDDVATAEKYGALVNLFLNNPKSYSDEKRYNADVEFLSTSFDKRNILGPIFEGYLKSGLE